MREKSMALGPRDLERLVSLANLDTRLCERHAASAALAAQAQPLGGSSHSPQITHLLAELSQEIRVLEERRGSIAHDLPEEVLAIYVDLKERDRHPPVVSVSENTCLGCNHRLPMPLLEAIRQKAALHRCPRCARLLYHPRQLRAPAPKE